VDDLSLRVAVLQELGEAADTRLLGRAVIDDDERVAGIPGIDGLGPGPDDVIKWGT
jgi:hypothetical protein